MEHLKLILFNLNSLYEGLSVTHLMIINVITLLIVIVLVVFILSQKSIPDDEKKDITKNYKPIIEESNEIEALDKITDLLESKAEQDQTQTFEEEQENTAIISYDELMKNAALPVNKESVDIPLTKVVLPTSEEKPNDIYFDKPNEYRDTIKQLFDEPTNIKKTNDVKHEEFLSDLKSLKGKLK